MTTTASYSFNVPADGTENGNWGTLLRANWEKGEDLLKGETQVVCVRWKSAALGATALSPDTSNMLTYTMSSNTTFTDSLADGDWLVLHLSGGDSFTATWPTITWVGGAEPSLTASDAISIYKLGSSLYGVNMGTLA